ncbi:hypothetical protein E2C01_071459 [Portunus trituberculatus]|uniref:Uncharacterized protein n=1 Tax=Portunus trituberculatus TaxID=210409 RepID=A0A5B7HX25_PORTR|nr:hypothetical protein [Portunus trituberculatus]
MVLVIVICSSVAVFLKDLWVVQSGRIQRLPSLFSLRFPPFHRLLSSSSSFTTSPCSPSSLRREAGILAAPRVICLAGGVRRASARAAPSLSVAEWEIRVSSRLPAHNQIITKVSPALNTSRLTLPPPPPLSVTPAASTRSLFCMSSTPPRVHHFPQHY